MSQDVVSDALNMIQNAKRARKDSLEVNRVSNLLIEVLKIMKQKGAVKKYKINAKDKSVEIILGDFIKCKAIKPRYTVKKDQFEKYRRRFLPAKEVGTLIFSTNKGVKTHSEVEEEGLGGILLAYFY
ncbi:MAG: 30S ribosomal protein S8 [Candidatus Pacearchaeota archaeon]